LISKSWDLKKKKREKKWFKPGCEHSSIRFLWLDCISICICRPLWAISPKKNTKQKNSVRSAKRLLFRGPESPAFFLQWRNKNGGKGRQTHIFFCTGSLFAPCPPIYICTVGPEISDTDHCHITLNSHRKIKIFNVSWSPLYSLSVKKNVPWLFSACKPCSKDIIMCVVYINRLAVTLNSYSTSLSDISGFMLRWTTGWSRTLR